VLSVQEMIVVPDFTVREVQEFIVKEQLSPNRITTFRNCPKRFQYRLFRLPSLIVDDTAIAFGTMLHSVIERFYKRIPIKPNPAKILQIANLCLEHEWLPRFQSKQRTAKKAVANFIQFEKWRLTEAKKQKIPYKTVDEEGNLTDPLTEVDVYSDIFHAIVDWYWGANAMMLDWKFGKSDTVYDGYKIQLSIERNVLEYNDMPVKYAGFGFFRKSPMPKRVGTHGISMLKDMRNQLLNAVESMHFPRKKGSLCWYCSDYARCKAEENGLSLWSGILG